MEYQVKIPVTITLLVRVGGANNKGVAIHRGIEKASSFLSGVTDPLEPRTIHYKEVSAKELPDGSPMFLGELVTHMAIPPKPL